MQEIKNPILTIFAKIEQPQFLEILQVYNGLVKNMYFDDFFEIGIISIFSIFWNFASVFYVGNFIRTFDNFCEIRILTIFAKFA